MLHAPSAALVPCAGLEQRPTKAEAASLVDGRPTAADLARALASLTSAMDEHARTEKAGRDELDRRLQALSASAVSREQLGAELDAKLKPLAQMQATLGQGTAPRARARCRRARCVHTARCYRRSAPVGCCA